MKNTWVVIFACLYLGPYLFLTTKIDLESLHLSLDIFYVIGWSSLQSLISATLILFGGYISYLGFSALKKSSHRILALFILLLPNFLPALVVIMSSLMFWEALGLKLQFGLWPVVIVHTAMNIGLCSIFWRQIIQSKLGGMLELAMVEGVKGLRLHGLIWKLVKKDLFLLGFGFFILCFTSFAIPLILGANTGRTLEVYAYEILSIHSSIGGALAVGFLQWFLFAVALVFVKPMADTAVTKRVELQSLNQPIYLLLPTLAFAFCCFGLFYNCVSGFQEFLSNAVLVQPLPILIRRSFLISAAVGVLTYLLFYFSIYATQNRFFRGALLSYTTPSVVLYGLGFYFLPLQVSTKLALGMALMFLPILYRLQGASILNGLKNQIEVAQSMGARPSQIVNVVVWPQVRGMALMFAGVAALWASGDFAFSSIISGEISNLALSAKAMLGSYHLELALVYVWLAFIVGFLVFTVFWGLSYVVGGKFKFENWGV